MTWPFLPHHIAVADLVIVFHLALDVGDGKSFRGAAGEVALEHATHVVECQVGVVGERHLVDDFGDGAFSASRILRAEVSRRMYIWISLDMENDGSPSLSRYSSMKLFTMPSFVSISGGWMSKVPPELNRVM